MSWLLPTLWWYIATLLATIACMPITLYLFRRCRGQGSTFARPVAMIATIWPVWFLSSVFPELSMWSGAILWGFLLLIAATGWNQIMRRRTMTAETIFRFVVAELAFAAMFAAGLWFRGYGPNTDFTEKPSELMMLSSVMHTSAMPPTDAWLSGYSLNYYYFGYVIWGGFGKMTALSPAEVFNLALITTFAMGFVAIAGLVAMVISRFHAPWIARLGGIGTAVLAMIIGNPWATWRVLDDNVGDGYWQGIGWKASRIISDSSDQLYDYNPITEFPSFSFILGDLHPHVMALPFVATTLGLAWVLLTLGRVPTEESFWRRNAVTIAGSGAFIGSLYVLNSWDFPTYAGIAMLALMLGTIGIGWRAQLGAVVLFGATSIIAWLPFHLQFVAPSNPVDSPVATVFGRIPVIGGIVESIDIYQGLATTPGEFFSVFGFQYAVLLAVILGEVVRRRDPVFSKRLWRQGERPYNDPVSGYVAAGFGVLCLIGAIVLPVHLLLFCGLPVIVIWLLLERDARLTPANISLVLFALALLLLLIPEFFYINDIYNSRMNTVFKVSYQVWLLMSIASGIGIVALWKSVRVNIVLRYLVPLATTAMLLAGLAYPVVGGQQWLDWRNPHRDWVGIDGLAYLKTNPESAEAGEYEAIQWLLEHSEDDDVILAAGGGEWDSAVGRVSGGSGVPTIIGWVGHERQWHLDDDEVLAEFPQRVNDIDAMYAATPAPELLDRYGVTLLYVGPVELNGAPTSPPKSGYMSITPIPMPNDPAFPGEGWELVFEDGDVRIYRRMDDYR